MTLTDVSQILGNFGEFFGAIAVVATLFYLATQIRHSANATKAAVRQGVDSAISASLGLTLDARTLTAGKVKGTRGEPLDELEEANVFTHNVLDFKGMEGAFRLYRLGLLEKVDWVATENVIRMKFELDPVARTLWDPSGPWGDTTKMYAADFADRVRELLGEVEPASDMSR